MRSALSNKNNDSIREMTKKLIASSSSSYACILLHLCLASKDDEVKTQTTSEGQKKGAKQKGASKTSGFATFGARKAGEKRAANRSKELESPPIKTQKRGMLAFSEDSDSDHL